MTSEEKKTILDGLVSNGLRHLDRGLRGFETGDFDFAVTDAFFGIEIILKALVFDGQWELIFLEPGHASLEKLKAGSCKTIGYEQAIARLTTLLGRKLPQSRSHFGKLQKHRNKLVHFFHPGLSNQTEKSQVASDLVNAWAALRQLREQQSTAAVFGDHAGRFHDLEGRLLILDAFLDQQAVAIRSAHADANSLEECPACKRLTFDGDCALCGYSEPSHRDICNGADGTRRADCPKCGELEGVVPSGDHARCTSCGRTYFGIGVCEFCGESFVADPDAEEDPDLGSYHLGCKNCGGNLAYQMSKDD